MTASNALRMRDLISGKKARQYRQTLAKYSDRPSDSMLTLKFKLEPKAEALKDFSFSDFRSLYKVIEGTGSGSLTSYLFTLILSGFRTFSNAEQAVIFSTKDAFKDDAFKERVAETFGGELPLFIPSKIKARLAKGVRSTGGKDNRFCAEVIAREYRNELAKKLPKEVDETLIDDVFLRIGQSLESNFSGWNDLTKDLIFAADCIDTALAQYGDFPSLKSMFEAGESTLPHKSSIAFDKSSVHTEYDEAFAPYLVVATVLRHCPDERKKASDSSYVKENLTTATNNALSWLFNSSAGLGMLRECSIDELCRMYGVPESRRHSMQCVQQAAQALPVQSILVSPKTSAKKIKFEPLDYLDFRSVFGGHIDSWVSNYISRLYEIKEILEKLPEDLKLPVAFVNPQGEDFLATTNVERSGIELLLQQMSVARVNALNSIAALLGQTSAVQAKDVKVILATTALINRLEANYKQILNALDQAENDRNGHWCSLKEIVKSELNQWSQLVSLPKMNQLSGGVPDVEAELTQAFEHYQQLLKAQRDHFNEIVAWDKTHDSGAILQVLIRAEQQKIDKRKGHKGLNARSQAIRWILDRVGKIVRQSDDEVSKRVVSWFDDIGVFYRKTDRNTFFCNRVKTLYVSPFATRNQTALPIRNEIVEHAPSVLEGLRRLIGQLSVLAFDVGRERETMAKLEKFWMSLYMQTRPEGIPFELAQLKHPEILEGSIPEDLQLQLAQDVVSNSALNKLFNLYFSFLSGLQTVLRREQFYLRTKFTWIKNNRLYYVPKHVEWAMPDRYRDAWNWVPIIESGVLQYAESGKVDVVKTFQAVAQNKTSFAKLTPLLVQLPHDWCYELPFEIESKDFVTVCQFDKGKVLTRLADKKALARLVGPSSMKSQLDELMTSDHVTLSDMNLLIDQPVAQKKSQLEYQPYQLTLAMPLGRKATKLSEEDKKFQFKRIVAIDQGEIGLAYSVFDLADVGNPNAQPITSGTIRIPSIRRLIKGVNKFRKSGQKLQKFNQRFDSTMFNIRENVTGDVCGVIEGLMHRFNAFPVLENEVKNLESGSSQLKLVYKAVNARFTFSNVQAQNTEREAWWYKASKWSTPFFRESSMEFGESASKAITVEGKRYRALNLFPGTTVRAAMTSRICSVCGGNAYELYKQAREKKIQKVFVDIDGEVELLGQTLRLYRKPTKDEIRKAARRNERAPMNVPYPQGELTLDELKKVISYNMRRAPRSLMSKDTSQSHYFCVFKDCSAHNQDRHADINASINIGRRFLADVINMYP